MERGFGVVVLASREVSGALLVHAALTALLSGAAEVVVTVGSEAARDCLRCLPVRTVLVRGGRGDAIAAGVQALSERVDAVVVSLANRVRVTPDHLRALARCVDSKTPIVASAYDGVVGAPAAFARSEFSSLCALRGSSGAQALLGGVPTLACDGGNVRTGVPVQASPPPMRTARLRSAVRRRRPSRAPPSRAPGLLLARL